MKLRVFSLFIATLITALGLPTPALNASGRVEFTIDVDPGAPSATAWMAYLIARLSYVTKHPSEYPANGKGVVVATFPEELAGRITGVEMYQKILKEGRIPHDAYWDDVVKVAYAGYLPEYVWTYFRKPSWKQAAAPKKLAQFSAWQKTYLPAHQPATHGGLEYGKSR